MWIVTNFCVEYLVKLNGLIDKKAKTNCAEKKFLTAQFVRDWIKNLVLAVYLLYLPSGKKA